jgi:hypothetical protein
MKILDGAGVDIIAATPGRADKLEMYMEIGKHLVNLSLITHLDMLEGGGCSVYFSGVSERAFALDPTQTARLVGTLKGFRMPG